MKPMLYAAGSNAALLAAMHCGVAPETKDGDVSVELKSAVGDLSKAFEAFKTKNDERLAQAEKKGEDAVTKAEVEKLNAALTESKTAVQRQIDDILAKANRLALNGGGGTDAEAKAARSFGELVGKADYSVEQLTEYKGDLGLYLRRAEVKGSTMMVASDPSGGYWVTPETSGRMVKKVYETSPMRQLASVVSIGTDALEGPIDNGEMDAKWVGEREIRVQTDTPEIGMWKIPVNELYAYPMVTQKLLEDSKVDVEAFLGAKAGDKFGRKENTAFFNGTGQLQPRGLLTYGTAATDDLTRAWGTFEHVVSGHASGFAATAPADALITLIFTLKAAYRPGARFAIARKTLAAIRKLKDGQGNYLVDLRLRDGVLVETIFGFPVVDAEDMPGIGANAIGIAFGDFAETYTIVDRLGISVVRDNITKPGFVKYHMRKRVGGGAINFESMKFLKFST